MKLNEYIRFLLLVLLSFTGCISDDHLEGIGEENEVTFMYRVPGMTVSTYSSTPAIDVEENRITTVDILLFSEGGSENFHSLVQINGDKINNPTGVIKAMKAALPRTGNRYRIVLLANLRGVVDAVKSEFTTSLSKQQVLEKVKFNFSAPWPIMSTSIPMWGESEEFQTLPTEKAIPTISMLRAFAAFDFGLRFDEAFVAQGFTDNDFFFKEVHLMTYNQQGQAAPYSGNCSGGKVTNPSVPLPVPAQGAAVFQAAAPSLSICDIYAPEYDNTTPGKELVFVIGGYYRGSGTLSYYCIKFEDNMGNRLDVLRNYRYLINITSVTGAGHPSVTGAIDNGDSYIGVEIIPWDEFLYSTAVTGHYTLEVSPLNFTCDYASQTIGNAVGNELTITTDYNDGWEVGKITEVVDGIETELTTGNFWLQPSGGVSGGGMGTSRMNIALTENTGTEPRVGKIYIEAGRWTQSITVEQCAYQGVDVSPSNCYMLAPGGRGINIPVSRANDAIAGSIGATDELTAELLWTDNPAGMRSVSGNANASIKSIKVLGRGMTGRVQVIPGATKLGNAVVVVKVGGVVKWSWHIWVTNYNPNTLSNYLLPLAAGDKEYAVPNGYVGAIASGTTVIPDGYDPQTFGPGSWSYAPAVMDRSLGCTDGSWEALYSNYAPTGLFYQWGRKDPFIGTGGIARGSSTLAAPVYDAAGTQISFNNISGGGLAATITNPGALSYNYKADDGSWGYAVDSNPWAMYPWNSGAGKSVYDPCPEGWMVERHGFWTKFIREGSFKLNRVGTLGTTTMSRRADVAFGVFSLSGYIVPGAVTNTYMDVSENAALWAATGKVSNNAITDDAYCCLFNYEFDTSGTYYSFPEGSLNRSYAAQVRCMKEYKFD